MSFAGSSGAGQFRPASLPTETPPALHPSEPATYPSEPATHPSEPVTHPSEPTTPPIPRLGGRFLLQRRLRSATAADIWLAVDEKLNRAVAVYLMGSGEAASHEVLSAARLAAGVPDTRFVQVLDAVDDGNSAYVVTEWLTDAVDLASILAGGPLPSWEAIALTREVAEAIASAHVVRTEPSAPGPEQRVAHRVRAGEDPRSATGSGPGGGGPGLAGGRDAPPMSGGSARCSTPH